LEKSHHVVIDQRVEWLECMPVLSCCEVANEYTIYKTEDNYLIPENESGREIGKVVEKNSNPVCLFCCKMCREYENELHVESGTNAHSACHVKRPFKCVCFPYLAFIDFCKPEIHVKKGETTIGTVEWPCWCMCWPARGCLSCMEFDIKDG